MEVDVTFFVNSRIRAFTAMYRIADFADLLSLKIIMVKLMEPKSVQCSPMQ